jgi:hypothetical protein
MELHPLDMFLLGPSRGWLLLPTTLSVIIISIQLVGGFNPSEKY